jgi:hypothetical protein
MPNEKYHNEYIAALKKLDIAIAYTKPIVDRITKARSEGRTYTVTMADGLALTKEQEAHKLFREASKKYIG